MTKLGWRASAADADSLTSAANRRTCLRCAFEQFGELGDLFGRLAECRDERHENPVGDGQSVGSLEDFLSVFDRAREHKPRQALPGDRRNVAERLFLCRSESEVETSGQSVSHVRTPRVPDAFAEHELVTGCGFLKGGKRRSERSFDVGLREIVALEEQWDIGDAGGRICEAVAEVQRCWMTAFAEAFPCRDRNRCVFRVDRNDQVDLFFQDEFEVAGGVGSLTCFDHHGRFDDRGGGYERWRGGEDLGVALGVGFSENDADQ